MSNLPNKIFLRRGEVREFLGVEDRQMTKLVEGGLLKPHYLKKGRKKGRAFFLRTQVVGLEGKMMGAEEKK